MRFLNPVAMLREKRRERDQASEVEALYSRLKDDVQRHNNRRPNIATNNTSSMEVALEFIIDAEEQMDILHEAFMSRDLEALKVYALFSPDDKLCTKQALKEIIEIIRRTGYCEVHTMERSVFQNVGRIHKALIVERKDHETKMAKHFELGVGLGYVLIENALMTACALGPKPVVDYLLENTRQALDLAGERRIMDHDHLIEAVELILTSDSPALVDGML
jgi:hypothetical protein